jgi:hypothetical protein
MDRQECLFYKNMARGWESKSVEAQIEEEDRAYEAGRKEASDRSNAQDLRLESLRLSRVRIEAQLTRAVHAAHREMLMKALQAIEKETEQVKLELSQDKK